MTLEACRRSEVLIDGGVLVLLDLWRGGTWVGGMMGLWRNLKEVVTTWWHIVACSVNLLSIVVCLHADTDLGAVRHHFPRIFSCGILILMNFILHYQGLCIFYCST